MLREELVRKVFLLQMSKKSFLPIDIIENNINDVDFNNILRFNQNINEIIELWPEKNNWRLISANKYLSEKSIEKYSKYIFWNILSHVKRKYTLQFIDSFHNELDWHGVSYYGILSHNIFMKYRDKINYRHILSNKNINILTLNYLTTKKKFISANINQFLAIMLKKKFIKYINNYYDIILNNIHSITSYHKTNKNFYNLPSNITELLKYNI